MNAKTGEMPERTLLIRAISSPSEGCNVALSDELLLAFSVHMDSVWSSCKHWVLEASLTCVLSEAYCVESFPSLDLVWLVGTTVVTARECPLVQSWEGEVLLISY